MNLSFRSIARISDVQRRRKLILRLMAIPLVLLAFVSASRWSDESLLHEGGELVGMILIVVCIAGRSWCTMYIGGRKTAELVRIGPYSVVRNPLYLFSLLGVTGVGLMTGSVLLGLILGAFCLLVFDRLARREEMFLQDRFGLEYQRYQTRTGRWWPAFYRWRDAPSLTVRPHLVLITFRDACVFLLASPLLEGLEALQRTGLLPVLLYLP